MIGCSSIINYCLCILGLIVDINAMSVAVKILPWNLRLVFGTSFMTIYTYK